MRLIALSLVIFGAASAQNRDIPDKHIPPAVLMELRLVQSDFRKALASDCSPDRCYVKGCVYQEHMTLDQPREGSLPGLPVEEGPGSVVPQEYLTRVLCEFTHEKTVRARDVKKLAQRLEKRLSHGWLNVTVVPEALAPIPKRLSEPLPEPEEKKEEKKEIEPPPPPPEPEELTKDLALRQLWEELLPHSPWMIAILLLTFAVMFLIWAGRRLGAPSIEDKMLEAQLSSGIQDENEAKSVDSEVVESPPDLAVDDFADEAEKEWNQRLDSMSPEDDVISRLLREWLKAGEYPMLARALLIFGDRVSQAFESSPELAIKKVEFAAYFRDVDESTLPTRERFFRNLSQQAMASLLLSQEDVKLYRSLREDFGASGFVDLMAELTPRYGALLFALVDYGQQQDVANLLTNELRVAVAVELLSSTRISMNESQYLTSCVEAVRTGESLPPPIPSSTALEHGPAIDSATALSLLLPNIEAEQRHSLFADARARHGGALPHWYSEIAFNHMLTALPDEIRNDALLEIDVRGLSAWLQTQKGEWRDSFTRELSDALQNALQQNKVTSSRGELIRWAKKGHEGIVTALNNAYERKGIRFDDLVA
jgi:hypothetical protein